MAVDLSGLKVAIIATDMVEEVELVEPRQALEDAGVTTELLSPRGGQIISAKHFDKSKKYKVDALLGSAEPAAYDALLIPGGALNADFIRIDPQAQKFVQKFDEGGKPMAVICHGPWLLVSAGVAEGRTLTSFHTIADDIRNAGAEWVDRSVVIDENIITSRKPDDIPAFNRAALELFATAK